MLGRRYIYNYHEVHFHLISSLSVYIAREQYFGICKILCCNMSIAAVFYLGEVHPRESLLPPAFSIAIFFRAALHQV